MYNNYFWRRLRTVAVQKKLALVIRATRRDVRVQPTDEQPLPWQPDYYKHRYHSLGHSVINSVSL